MHRITVDKRERAVLVEASGELDAYVAPELTAALEHADLARRVVADLTSVSFLDSTALGVLVRSVRTRESHGAETRIVLPRGTARRIFEITSLDQSLPVSASVEEALR